MIIHFDNLGQYGVVKDVDPYSLPLNAWSDSRNIRFTDNAVVKFTGQETFVTATAAPIFSMPMQVQGEYWWNYESENDIYHTDGTTHYCVSEATGSASASLDYNWTGGPLGGGVYVLNTGVRSPLAWTGSSIATAWGQLANWPAGMTAQVLRPFKNFLVAADIDEGAGRDGTLLRWSHPAPPGSVPASWDYSDPAYDAGRVQLAVTDDPIIDMWSLRDVLAIYKENSVYSMQYIGGNNIFGFRQAFTQFGILSRRCVTEVKGSHAVLTGDNIIVHDFNQITEVLNSKWRRWLANNIDPTYYKRSFVMANHSRSELWACFPMAGYTMPNMALVWSWKENTVYLRELPNQTAHGAYGIVNIGSVATFDNTAGTFDGQLGIWDETTYAGAYQFPLLIDYGDVRMSRADSTQQFNGVNMTAYVQRDQLPLGRYPNKPEPHIMKYITSIEPIIEGTTGGVVDIYFYVQDKRNGTVSTKGPYKYTIGTSRKLNVRVSGRDIGVKFQSDSNIAWQLHSYALDVQFGGRR